MHYVRISLTVCFVITGARYFGNDFKPTFAKVELLMLVIQSLNQIFIERQLWYVGTCRFNALIIWKLLPSSR